MKVSLNWLNEFVDIKDLSPAEVAEKLTMHAFEVEGVETSNDQPDSKIVLGKILEIEKHPDADKLQVTKTQVGTDDIRQIVCGAKNIAVGQHIPVATKGAKLCNIKGDEIVIKDSAIRGVESFGMLCGVEELAFDERTIETIKKEQGDGIYILKPEQYESYQLGTPIREVLGIQEDLVLDVGARSNRGDALSIIGQARELAALLKRDFKEPSLNALDTYNKDESLKTLIPVIEAEADTKLFYTLSISGIKVKDSPQWLADRLKSSGTKSINNLVDISNYVQHELGQPLHFYDLDKLEGAQLTARRARSGESELQALDDGTYKLTELNLVIADESMPVGIAGVMGGSNSQITKNTKNILIEAAVFNSATVRKSARQVGIDSEAKKRYERGVDTCNTLKAILKSLEMIKDLATEQADSLKISELNQAGALNESKLELTLTKKELKRILGIEVDLNDISDRLKPLGFEVLEVSNNKSTNIMDDPSEAGFLKCIVPSYREQDVYREVDLVEEVARLIGFDQIPARAPKLLSKALVAAKPEKYLAEALKFKGFSQIILSSLTKAEPDNKLVLEMDNPLSLEYSSLRSNMLKGLVKCLSTNLAYDDSKDYKLFELGKVYELKSESSSELEEVIEKPKLALAYVINNKTWQENKLKSKAELFFEFKSIIENLYPGVKFEVPDFNKEALAKQYFHPGMSAKIIYNGKPAGYLGCLHPKVCETYSLPEHAIVSEIELARIPKYKIKEANRQQLLKRDITVDEIKSVSYKDLIEAIKKAKIKNLLEPQLLDTYGDSYTLRLRWLSETAVSRESTDESVTRIKDLLESKLGVKFRV
jgi:phenylalanyl-tRNA synthetase beta chain